MEEHMISRRQGLKALGAAAAGAVLLGTGMSGVAKAAPSKSSLGPLTGYSLTVHNNSTNFFDMCMYQEQPDLSDYEALSLAWFSNPTYPSTHTTFTWNVDYSFVWSETGELSPGVHFAATQAWPADPNVVGVSTPTNAGNQVSIVRDRNAYTFVSKGVAKAQPGTLYIAQDPSIPLRQAAVGIGMSGAGTFAVQAQPRLQLTFTPHPKYYLVAGSFQQGEVLDIGSLTNVLEIHFKPGVTTADVTLNEDNSWTVN
jgi:hypothetical protein